MKNLLITAIVLASFLTPAQNCAGIYQISNDTVTVGDSAWVGIATSMIGSLTDTIRIQIGFGCQVLPSVAKYCLGQFKAMKKYYFKVNDNVHNFYTDSITRLYFIMPKPCSFGIATYYLGFPNPGNCGLPKNANVFIKDSTQVVIPPNSINEISPLSEITSIEYFDFSGRNLGVNKPEATGIYIQRIRYRDFTYKLRKILI